MYAKCIERGRGKKREEEEGMVTSKHQSIILRSKGSGEEGHTHEFILR